MEIEPWILMKQLFTNLTLQRLALVTLELGLCAISWRTKRGKSSGKGDGEGGNHQVKGVMIEEKNHQVKG